MAGNLVLDTIRGVTAGLAGPVVDYMKRGRELRSQERIRKAELNDAIHQRQMELVRAGLDADALWEMEQIKNSGWKDEYVLAILSIPLIGCFLPVMAPLILTGFSILEKTPQWYQWLVLAILTAVFGIRIWRRVG